MHSRPEWVISISVLPRTTILPLPVSAEELELAGKFFFFDTRKARQDIGLLATIPARTAIEEAFAWFKQTGAIQ